MKKIIYVIMVGLIMCGCSSGPSESIIFGTAEQATLSSRPYDFSIENKWTTEGVDGKLYHYEVSFSYYLNSESTESHRMSQEFVFEKKGSKWVYATAY